MHAGLQTQCTAFEGAQCIAAGELADVALKAKTAVDKGEQVLIFDDTTSESIEVDFRGSAEDVLRRLARTGARIGSANRKRPPIGSCPSWLATGRVSRRQCAPCLRVTATVSTN